MKRGTIDHPKCKELAASIADRCKDRFTGGVAKDLCLTIAIGTLERLWHFTARYAVSGDVGKYRNQQIADSVGWSLEDADWLCDALVECRFLDTCQKHRLVVHGWSEHSDDTADRWMADNGKVYACGTLPRNKPRKGSKGEFGPLPVNDEPKRAETGDDEQRRDSARLQNQNQYQNQDHNQNQKGSADAGGSLGASAQDVEDDKSSAKGKQVVIPEQLNTPAFLAQWEEWLAYRRERKLPVTHRTLKAQLKSLLPLGAANAAACVNESIAKVWQGLFPENYPTASSPQDQAFPLLDRSSPESEEIFVPEDKPHRGGSH